MKKTCIGCKREISWGQKDCPFCGASQSYIKHYFKSGTMVVGLLAVAGWAGYSIYEASLIKAELKIAQQQSQQLSQSNSEIERLKQALEESNNKLAEASQSIADAAQKESNDSSKAQAFAQDLQAKLTQAEKQAKDQAGRAGWLSRENNRLKTEIKALEDKVALLQPSETTNSVTAQDAPPTAVTPPTNSDDSSSDDNSDGDQSTQ